MKRTYLAGLLMAAFCSTSVLPLMLSLFTPLMDYTMAIIVGIKISSRHSPSKQVSKYSMLKVVQGDR